MVYGRGGGEGYLLPPALPDPAVPGTLAGKTAPGRCWAGYTRLPGGVGRVPPGC